MNALDAWLLAKAQAQHPRSSILVLGGFLDGTIGKEFGSVPHDWDGTSWVYDFRRRA